MQLFSFIPRYFARRKALANLREQCDEARLGNSETAKLLMELRAEARGQFHEVLSRVDRLGRKLEQWECDGVPARREEFRLLPQSDAARENAEQAREGAERACTAAGIASQMAKWNEAGAPPVSDKDAALGAPVYDADYDLQIMGILGVNAKAGWVLVADLPVQLTEHGHIKSRRLRFKKIVQFDPNDQSSGSFHCYGRLPDGKEGA